MTAHDDAALRAIEARWKDLGGHPHHCSCSLCVEMREFVAACLREQPVCDKKHKWLDDEYADCLKCEVDRQEDSMIECDSREQPGEGRHCEGCHRGRYTDAVGRALHPCPGIAAPDVAALREEVEMLRRDRDAVMGGYEALKAEHERAGGLRPCESCKANADEVKHLRARVEALQPYLHHTEMCSFVRRLDGTIYDCDCGLSALESDDAETR